MSYTQGSSSAGPRARGADNPNVLVNSTTGGIVPITANVDDSLLPEIDMASARSQIKTAYLIVASADIKELGRLLGINSISNAEASLSECQEQIRSTMQNTADFELSNICSASFDRTNTLHLLSWEFRDADDAQLKLAEAEANARIISREKGKDKREFQEHVAGEVQLIMTGKLTAGDLSEYRDNSIPTYVKSLSVEPASPRGHDRLTQTAYTLNMRKRQISGPDQEDTASQSERSILWWSLGENEDGHSTIRCYLDENAREAKEPLVQLCLQLFEGINTDNLQRASTIPDAARVLVDMLTIPDTRNKGKGKETA
jgi:hypothetical protein